MWRVLGGFALALIATACVDNGDTGDAAAQGTLGGPCFPNNTCNGSLVCTLVNGKGVCQEGDASVQDTGSDTTVSDAPGGDVASDVAPDVPCTSQITTPCSGQQCHQQTKGCCEKLGACGSNAADCNGSPLFDCTSGSDCTGNLPCCVNGQFNPSTCPISMQATGLTVQCTTAAVCPTGAHPICANSSECPSSMPVCTPFMVESGTFGMCM